MTHVSIIRFGHYNSAFSIIHGVYETSEVALSCLKEAWPTYILSDPDDDTFFESPDQKYVVFIETWRIHKEGEA